MEKEIISRQLKLAIYKDHMLILQAGSFSDKSKCEVKNCKKKVSFMLFVGEDTRLSTFYCQSCNNHLARVCNKTLKYALLKAQTRIQEAEDRQIKAAKELLTP